MTAIIQYDHPQARSIESELELMAPRFGDVLGPIMQPERLIRSIMISMDRNRKLFDCDRQSIVMAAMSAACVGLECDGVLGQAFLVPFKDKKRGLLAQMMTGYRGYVTLAARGGFTIRGGIVRKGDTFEYDRAAGEIRHKEKPDRSGDIVATWARAVSNHLPPAIEVVPIAELMELRARAKSVGTEFSPWNDPKIGFPAMCEKTPKRRLSRSLPLGQNPGLMQYAIAAHIDEAVEERGLPAWATPEAGVNVGYQRPDPVTTQARAVTITVGDDDDVPSNFANLPPQLRDKALRLLNIVNTIDNVAALEAQWRRIPNTLEQIRAASGAAYDALVDRYDKRHQLLTEAEEGTK